MRSFEKRMNAASKAADSPIASHTNGLPAEAMLSDTPGLQARKRQTVGVRNTAMRKLLICLLALALMFVMSGCSVVETVKTAGTVGFGIVYSLVDAINGPKEITAYHNAHGLTKEQEQALNETLRTMSETLGAGVYLLYTPYGPDEEYNGTVFYTSDGYARQVYQARMGDLVRYKDFIVLVVSPGADSYAEMDVSKRFAPIFTEEVRSEISAHVMEGMDFAWQDGDEAAFEQAYREYLLALEPYLAEISLAE